MKHMRNEKGVTVIAAIATLMVLSLMGTVVVSLVGIENYSALHQAQTVEAYWIAEAGIQRALTYISRENGNCTTISGAAQFTNVTLGRGTFLVVATRYTSSTTLSANITAAQTTITVGSTTGFHSPGTVYASRGRIAIDSELIDYTGTTATTFTGAKRGMDGTTAALHNSPAAVAQYQCMIKSTGTVTSGFGDAKRVVEAVAQ
ncbi:MAG: hypothetical protein ACREKR_00050 [Candidatus Methylomirabilales bacterium]